MSGIHDLGGKEGYGPIDVNEPEEPFHAEWEGRMWGISRMARHPSWTIDWWRHVRELIDKDDYLNRPYFDSWAQTHMAAFIDAGSFTLEEILNAQAPAPTGNSIDAIAQNREWVTDFSRPVETQPSFEIGQSVQTTKTVGAGHTRLPEYARGKTGVIHAYRNAHIFPDDSAKGHERPEHLYTVGFKTKELWGSGEHDDQVFLDLWESYLAPA